VERVSLNGEIGKPMLTLSGTLDTLLPIRRHSDPYRQLIENQGKGKLHRYFVIEDGSHVDSWNERYRTELRPILPCYWVAFGELEEWVEHPNSPDGSPPNSKFVPKPEDPTANLANQCSISQEATYSQP